MLAKGRVRKVGQTAQQLLRATPCLEPRAYEVVLPKGRLSITVEPFGILPETYHTEQRHFAAGILIYAVTQ